MATADSGEVVLLDANNNYNPVYDNGEIFKVPSGFGYIVNFDWDSGTRFIQATTSQNKYIFLEFSDEIKLVTEIKKVQSLDWPAITCKFGFSVQGVYMGSTDPKFISSVCKAHTKKVVCSGDDDKFLNLYNFPCISETPKVKSFKGHAGHIRRIIFIFRSE
mgnify:CR=1 FL=1